MKKLFSLFVFAPIAIALIILSVANRHPVVFNLDPINPEQPFLSISLPFFVFLFIALLTGLLLGSIFTWFTQSKHRRLARETRREAEKWHREADEQKERAIQAQAAQANREIIAEGENAANALPAPNKAA